MRYFLSSPAAQNSRLVQKGQDGSMPIYHCQTSNTFWILTMQISGERHLLKYDPQAGTVDRNESTEVPSDWEGEPQTIGIDHITWQDFQHPEYAHNLQGIKDLILNGDYVCLIDDHNRITHLLTLDSQGNFNRQQMYTNS